MPLEEQRSKQSCLSFIEVRVRKNLSHHQINHLISTGLLSLFLSQLSVTWTPGSNFNWLQIWLLAAAPQPGCDSVQVEPCSWAPWVCSQKPMLELPVSVIAACWAEPGDNILLGWTLVRVKALHKYWKHLFGLQEIIPQHFTLSALIIFLFLILSTTHIWDLAGWKAEREGNTCRVWILENQR